VGAQRPFDSPPGVPQSIPDLFVFYNELRLELDSLTTMLKWQGEKTALATDFLNTLCILMRQNQEERHDQTNKGNIVQPATVTEGKKNTRRTNTIS
jgi:hypothetical protein